MLRVAANLGFFYNKLPLLERFAAAAKDGIKAVEFMPDYKDNGPETFRKVLEDNSLTAALFNSPAGNWPGGERGLVGLPEREAEFLEAVKTTIEYAAAVKCPRTNFTAGIVPAGTSWDKVSGLLVERYKYVADQCAPHNITVLVEHMNAFDVPGYCVDTPSKALEIVKKVNKPNMKIQYDIYHAQRSEGELVRFMRDNLEYVDHIQIADNPARNQPGTGEINYDFIFAELERLNYQGWVGLEYKPTPNAGASLGWMKKWKK